MPRVRDVKPRGRDQVPTSDPAGVVPRTLYRGMKDSERVRDVTEFPGDVIWRLGDVTECLGDV